MNPNQQPTPATEPQPAVQNYSLLQALARLLRAPGSAISEKMNLGGMSPAEQEQLTAAPTEQELLRAGQRRRQDMLR